MSKNRKRYEYNTASKEEVVTDEPIAAEPYLEDEAPAVPIWEQTEGVCSDALSELVRIAKEFNGRDHLSACAYYVVSKRECDCGIKRLYLAAVRAQETCRI